MTAVKIVEILESLIEDQARLNPFSNASTLDAPFLISSFILSNIRTLASVAIPIERINPVNPAKDITKLGISLKTAKVKIM